VTAGLARRDCEVVSVDDLERLALFRPQLDDDAIGHCVQPLVHVASSVGAVVARVRTFLDLGLLARFEALSGVLPSPRPNASVVLVVGNLPGRPMAPDERQARISLPRVNQSRSPYEISAITVDSADNRLVAILDAAERYREMRRDNWRLEVLSLATVEG
jgi:hypothetical protein